MNKKVKKIDVCVPVDVIRISTDRNGGEHIYFTLKTRMPSMFSDESEHVEIKELANKIHTGPANLVQAV
jgi:hypothetical protein